MWYVLDGEETKGPYSIEEMIPMIQSSDLMSHCYVWTQGMKKWTPLAETRDFCKDRIDEIFQHKKSLFIERRSKRRVIETPLIIHDTSQAWPAKLKSVSINGAAFQAATPMFMLDEHIQVHFRKSQYTNPFTVDGRIISKDYRSDLLKHNSILNYCVRFENLTDEQREILESLVNSN